MRTRISFLLVGMLVIAQPVAAGTIENLTDEPQTIWVGREPYEEKITLPPYGKFSRLMPFHAKYHHHRLYVQQNIEYAIWPGNVIGPQRVRNSRSRGW